MGASSIDVKGSSAHTHTHGARCCEDLAQKLIYSGMLMQSAMFLLLFFFPSRKKGKEKHEIFSFLSLFFIYLFFPSTFHILFEKKKLLARAERTRKC